PTPGGARRSGCPTPRSPTARPSQHVDQALPDSPISYRSSLAARRSGSARLPDLLPLVPRSTSIRLCPTPRSPTARPSQHVDQALATETVTVPPETFSLAVCASWLGAAGTATSTASTSPA